MRSAKAPDSPACRSEVKMNIVCKVLAVDNVTFVGKLDVDCDTDVNHVQSSSQMIESAVHQRSLRGNTRPSLSYQHIQTPSPLQKQQGKEKSRKQT